ncbi:MAG: HEAT repeat domain-containing protein [Fibrobacteria bacterium]|nr:HEAT repeat domain-containing protein [Fibrobacteria bacterium]
MEKLLQADTAKKEKIAKAIKLFLGSPEIDKQIQGIKLAGKYTDYNSISLISNIISSPDQTTSTLAKSTALALAKKCLKDESDTLSQFVVSAAVQCINKFEPSYPEKLQATLGTNDVGNIINAITSLRHFLSEEQAAKVLNNILGHANNKIRASAVLHLGPLASKAKADLLSKFLDDSDNRVKANTIEVLEQSNNFAFIKIIEKFRKDENNRVRANALKALFNLGEKNIQKDVQSMLHDANPLIRSSAIWLLGELGRSAYFMLRLLEIVQHDEEDIIRQNLMLVLKKVGTAPQVDFLRVALKEDKRKEFTRNIINKKDLHITLTHTPHYIEIKTTGILTAQTILALKLKLDEIIKTESKFVMDFKEMEYIDSSGIGLLINLQKLLSPKKGFLYIYNCKYNIMELFQISKIDSFLQIFHNLKEVHHFLKIE